VTRQRYRVDGFVFSPEQELREAAPLVFRYKYRKADPAESEAELRHIYRLRDRESLEQTGEALSLEALEDLLENESYCNEVVGETPDEYRAYLHGRVYSACTMPAAVQVGMWLGAMWGDTVLTSDRWGWTLLQLPSREEAKNVSLVDFLNANEEVFPFPLSDEHWERLRPFMSAVGRRKREWRIDRLPRIEGDHEPVSPDDVKDVSAYKALIAFASLRHARKLQASGGEE
jgi:hypothetical protein